MTEVEKQASIAVDYADPFSCIAQVKCVLDQEHIRSCSVSRKLRHAAHVFQRSTGWVQQYRNLEPAVPGILQLLKERSIIVIDAIEIAKLPPERQVEMADAMARLTTREAVKEYLRVNLYKLEPGVTPYKKYSRRVQPAALPLAEPPTPEQEQKNREAAHKSRLSTEERLETKRDCRLAVQIAQESLEPLFDLPMSHIVTAFAGAPLVRAEFIHNAKEIQQMLGQIVAALKEQYGVG